MALQKSIFWYCIICFFATSIMVMKTASIETISKIVFSSKAIKVPLSFGISFFKFPMSTLFHISSFNKLNNRINETSTYFRFIPEFTLNIPTNNTIFFESKCFKNNSITSKSNKLYTTISLISKKPKSLLCQDFYMIANIKDIHVKSIWHGGNYQFKLKTSNNNPYLFIFKGSPPQMIYSLLNTAKLFLPYLSKNGHITSKVEQNNMHLLTNLANMSMPSVNKGYLHILDPKTVNSGDLLAIMRLDGLLPMEGFGMGSGTGHMAVALWIDGELYVVESTDKTNYWPYHGIQKNKWFDWMNMAYKANYIVEYLPLNEEQLRIFNTNAAVKWFKKVEGMPYGYNNYFFCWIDTPEDNYPDPLSSQFLEVGLSYIGTKFPDIAQKMWNKALCKRLNIQLNSTVDILEYAYKQNINFTDLMKIPEMDYWRYDGNYSMVCSVFVCALWKKARLFGDLENQIQCTEFHNWDVYSLNFFDHSKNNCEYLENRWCHIMGDYRLDLSGANTKKPYPRMAENCPSKAPSYIRPRYC